MLMRMRQPSTVDNVALQGACFVQDDDAGRLRRPSTQGDVNPKT
jgi:hypothetical protein